MKKKKYIKKLEKENDQLLSQIEILIDRPESLDAVIIRTKYRMIKGVIESALVGEEKNEIKGIYNQS